MNPIKEVLIITFIFLLLLALLISGNFIRVNASGLTESYAQNLEDPDNGGSSFPSLGDITDRLIGLVVPRDDFFQNEFDNLRAIIRDKLPYQTYIDTFGRLRYITDALDGNASALDFEFDYNGRPVNIELGRFIEPILPRIRSIITGLYVIFLGIYNYRQILFLIRGSTEQSGRTDC